MYLSDLISQLLNAEESVGENSAVFIRNNNQEVQLTSISLRIVDVDDYEIVLE